MPNIALDEPRPLPPWLKIGVSVVVVVHLTVFVCWALGASSGTPVGWFTPMGPSPADPPQFVRPITEKTSPYFLEPLRMTHNYHFATNHTAQPAVYFEVLLKDKAGQTLKTLKFPDDKANPWMRHRQQLLAQGLAQDQPLPPLQGEVIGPAGQRAEMTVWLTSDEIKKILNVEMGPATNNNELFLKKVPQHLVPRERPIIMTASEWSVTLAKSYARYLCRTHHADKAQIVRHTREAWSPIFLFMPDGVPIPPNDKLVCNFGEYTRD